jgi:uncharacterized membrane protein YukC
MFGGSRKGSKMLRKILRWVAIGLIVVVVLVAAIYFWDIHQLMNGSVARARLSFALWRY